MQGLSLETIPPIHFPLRFFLTAPWLGAVAGLVLITGDGHALASQWNPAVLAVAHLLTLGFMSMVMLGAMFQLVPVISGQLIPGGWMVVSLVHALLLPGVLLLAGGFSTQAYQLFLWAGPFLLAAFAVFFLALGSLLVRSIGGGDSIFCIRFAALSLLLTVAIGLLRSLGYTGAAGILTLSNATNLHLAWGLGGWTLLLVMGASYQVIPMFHVTPSYPAPLARALPLVVFVSLVLLSLVDQVEVQAAALASLAAAAIFYGIYSIRLLQQRKRKVADVTARFWRLSLGCLCLAGLLLTGFYFSDSTLLPPVLSHLVPVVIGILMIYGFAVSVIMGMLQKIVPFLVYLHLQRRCVTQFELLKTLPHMGDIVPAQRSRLQYRFHVAALLALLLACSLGSLAWLAGGFVFADFVYLGVTLSRASWLYRQTAVRVIREAGSDS